MKVFPSKADNGLCSLSSVRAEIGLSQSPEQTGSDAVRVTMQCTRTVHAQFTSSTTRSTRLWRRPPTRMVNSGRRFVTNWMRQAAFPAAKFPGPMAAFVSRAVTNTTMPDISWKRLKAPTDGTLLHKIVYSYDAAGKQTGYSVFDASGKLVGGKSAAKAPPIFFSESWS